MNTIFASRVPTWLRQVFPSVRPAVGSAAPSWGLCLGTSPLTRETYALHGQGLNLAGEGVEVLLRRTPGGVDGEAWGCSPAQQTAYTTACDLLDRNGWGDKEQAIHALISAGLRMWELAPYTRYERLVDQVQVIQLWGSVYHGQVTPTPIPADLLLPYYQALLHLLTRLPAAALPLADMAGNVCFLLEGPGIHRGNAKLADLLAALEAEIARVAAAGAETNSRRVDFISRVFLILVRDCPLDLADAAVEPILAAMGPLYNLAQAEWTRRQLRH